MIETNIRLVRGGPNLSLELRSAAVEGLEPDAEHLQRACNVLRNRHALAAVPDPDRPGRLLVATQRPVPGGRVVQDDLEFQIGDYGERSVAVSLATPSGRKVLPQVMERAVLIRALRSGLYWTLDSPRLLWERDPFQTADGIAAFRRFWVSAVVVEGVGIGVAVDISTAFVSTESLAWFFAPGLREAELKERRAVFDRLSGRQDGQKGTLIYKTSRGAYKCYFEACVPGVTCATTGRIVPNGRAYDSLAEYYRENQAGMLFDPNGPVIRVSFPNLTAGTLVAAERVRARVGNDSLPARLARVDKIVPSERRDVTLRFWSHLEPDPLGGAAQGLEPGLWQPDPTRVRQVAPPALVFGKGAELPRPVTVTQQTVRDHFGNRAKKLAEVGCNQTPPTIPRLIYVVCPAATRDAASQLAEDLAGSIRRLTPYKVTFQTVVYDSIPQAVATLREDRRSSAAVFVLNDELNAYYEVVHHLSDWRIKRMTSAKLLRHHRGLVGGHGNGTGQSGQDGRRRWENFVRINALELVQLLDAVPYRLARAGCFDAQLVIDVGHDRRHQALSVLLARDGTGPRSFQLLTKVSPKADPQRESINPVVLRDQVVETILSVVPHSAPPLDSLLVIRDGVCPDRERQAVMEAVSKLQERGKLTAQARVDIVELHKDTLHHIRIWEREPGGTTNALEGSILLLDADQVVVLPTGRATLTQGTAEPYLLRRVLGGDILDAAESCLDAGHLNWSSPRVAQRYPITLKRTDDELTARAEQEVRRIR